MMWADVDMTARGDEEWKTHRGGFRAEDGHGALFPPESFSKDLNRYHVCKYMQLQKCEILHRSSTEYYYKLVFQSRFLKLFSFPDQILNL